MRQGAPAIPFDARPLGRRVNGAEVVGVAADARMGEPRDPPPPAMFVPAFQQQEGSFCFQLRTEAPMGTLAPLVRRAVREVAPAAAAYDFTEVRRQVADSARPERLLAGLTSFLGVLTLLLASLGLYGLLAYSTKRRTREIGIRRALGARPVDVLWMALSGGLRLVVAGTALGVLGAWALSRLAAGLLYGVRPFDPAAVAGAVLLLLGVTLVACWLPARQAERTDPAVALRHE
jgi:ABC-type lipoprotein release transport system permease subunit